MDFEFFKHRFYPDKLNLIVRLQLNSSENVVFCSRDRAATNKLSSISLVSDLIFDKRYSTKIGELYSATTTIPYTKVTSIHYQTLSKKYTVLKIGVNSLSFGSLQDLLLLFLGKRDDFDNKY